MIVPANARRVAFNCRLVNCSRIALAIQAIAAMRHHVSVGRPSLAGGNPAFLDWISDETASGAS